MMERPTVWPAMLAAFVRGGDLADRPCSAAAAEAEGGDVRPPIGRIAMSGSPSRIPGIRFDLRVDDARAPSTSSAPLALNRAYEGRMPRSGGRRRQSAPSAFERAGAAPEDDQIRLWLQVPDRGRGARTPPLSLGAGGRAAGRRAPPPVPRRRPAARPGAPRGPPHRGRVAAGRPSAPATPTRWWRGAWRRHRTPPG
jgi:hypothetical protein